MEKNEENFEIKIAKKIFFIFFINFQIFEKKIFGIMANALNPKSFKGQRPKTWNFVGSKNLLS